MGFKRTLLQDVKLFVVDAVAFRQDWEASGPTVPGLDPMDATDRLRKFQQLFEVRVGCLLWVVGLLVALAGDRRWEVGGSRCYGSTAWHLRLAAAWYKAASSPQHCSYSR